MPPQREDDPVTVFMGVPTMYSHLLSYYDDMSSEEQAAAKGATQRLRLTVSGSAACPMPIMQRWHALSGAHRFFSDSQCACGNIFKPMSFTFWGLESEGG